ncbi:MAG TPA: S41 family peptidase [Candidatus Blautia intestinavium]|nr:S41 family peptidase [Candidatus Blautia intestinavium]
MKHKEYIRGVITGVLAAAAVAAGACFGYTRLAGGVLSDSQHVQKLRFLEALIDQEYLGEKDEDSLAEGLYKGLIYGLGDVYSCYYTKEEYEQENSSTEGSYVGIGVTIQKNPEGGVKIAECYEDGPGDQAGLKEGDVISAVDGTDITEMEASQVVEMIKNAEDKEVELTVHRQDQEEPLEISVKVQDVELTSVFGEMLDGKTGYIRILQFTAVTPDQYEETFAELENQGMERLVIDLRNNPGGLLTSVCEVLNDILPEGLIVYTEDKYGNRQEEYSEGKNPLEMPLAVLVNEGSASASEIFAGSVKDYGAGTIVGTTTYGKGVVQAVHQLEDGSAVKLTVSNYYTPKGNSINEVGIQPDVEVKLDTDLLNKEEISPEEDNQLQEAVKILEGQ